MVHAVVQFLFLRLLLPISLLVACVIRPSIFSFIYGVLLLALPLTPRPNRNGASGITKAVLLLCFLAGLLFTLAQSIFHITLAALSPYGHTLPYCSSVNKTAVTSEAILRLVGLQRLDGVPAAHVVRLIIPDVIVFLFGIATYVVCCVLRSGADTPPELPNLQGELPPKEDADYDSKPKSRFASVIKYVTRWAQRLGEVIWLTLLCASGVFYPSLLAVVYFLLFISCMAYWATYHPWRRSALRPIKLCIIIYVFLHIALLYIYQLPMVESELPDDTLGARLAGLTTLIRVDCTKPWLIIFPSLSWPKIVNPIILFIFYYYTAVQLRWLSDEMKIKHVITDDSSSIHEELLGGSGESEDDDIVRRHPAGTEQRPLSSGSVQRFGAVFGIIVRYSFALALIFMMAWAIVYHSWLSFVFLLLACLIWILPNTRGACLALSPLIVFYAQLLLIAQYIYCLNLYEDELPINKPTVLQQIGFLRPEGVACIPLIVKTLFSIPFWLVLRLFFRERHVKRFGPPAPSKYGTFSSGHSTSFSGEAGSFDCVNDFLVKYWIYFCIAILIFVSLRNPVVSYAVAYVVLYLLLVAIVQISWPATRKLLFTFWFLLVVISILVLIGVYIYQFHGIDEWFKNTTGLPNDVVESLGLEVYSPATLFYRFLTPISFLIVVVLQLKFFHGPFLRLTDMSTKKHKDMDDDENPAAGIHVEERGCCGLPWKKWQKTLLQWHVRICDFLWRVAEIHWPKIVALSFVVLSSLQPCAVHFPLVMLAGIMLLARWFHVFLAVIGTLWIGAIIIARMLFQMYFVPPQFKNWTCVAPIEYGTNSTIPTLGAAAWAGFIKDPKILHYCGLHILVTLILGFGAVIFLRQKYRRSVEGAHVPAQGILFPNIGRHQADDGLLECVMFLLNYGFYKFGVEISFITTVIVASIRMDGVAVLYVLCLLLLLTLRRRLLSRVWPIYALFLAIMLPVQYASVVGLPPSLCIQYPWPSGSFPSDLVIWLYFPSYINPPTAVFLVADFFQLLFVCCQLYMFRQEHSNQTDGGDNSEIVYNPDYYTADNPTNDFITYTKSYLDLCKVVIFMYSHWITLLVIFIAGTASISLFALGYLMAIFVLLWKGNEIFIKSMKRVYKWWWIILLYTTIVILLKTLLQVFGCVYWEDLTHSYCFIMQLFSIVCLRKELSVAMIQECHVSKDEARIAYDVAVFAFLIFQLRILASNYFKHAVKEFSAQKLLASCGAQLINKITQREIGAQEEKEERILVDIKAKMDGIKAAREEMAKKTGKDVQTADTYGAAFREAYTDAAESAATDYASAKRSGYYYMFEDVMPKKIDQLEPPSTGIAPDVDKEQKTADPLQLISAAVDQDFDLDRAQEEADKLGKRTKSTDEKEAEPSTGIGGKIKSVFSYVLRLFESFLQLLTRWFNNWSRNYRWVGFQLDKEKKKVKEDMSKPHDTCPDFELPSQSMETSFYSSVASRSKQISPDVQLDQLEKEVDEFSAKRNTVVRFLMASFYLAASKTELLCYIFIILNQMMNASLLSLPLPLMAFFWGTLYAPRPPKVFWITIITYTEALVILKFIFQFDFFPWNHDNSPDVFFPPRLVGIEQKAGFAVWDIILLMVLFYHRYILRSMGLWKNADESDIIPESPKEDILVDVPQNVDASGSSPRQSSGADGDVKEVDLKDITVDVDKGVSGTDPSRGGYGGGCKGFFQNLLHPTRWYLQDLYAAMFLCDSICFLILVFGYAQFGTAQGTTGDVLNIISDNKVPLPFILMLLVMFALIVIDRALYLRRFQMGKVAYHFFLVVLVHAWLFFILPEITGQQFIFNLPAKLWYFTKCVYFLLSASQIRSGFPTRILGNFLTKQYNIINMVLFKVFMAVPFLFELRAIMDWIWTDTCMSFFDWFKMENIYAWAYSTKCGRKMEKDYPFPAGQKRGLAVKYGMGFSILLFIIIVLWLPLLVFSLLNKLGLRLLPDKATCEISIEGYPAFYTSTAQANWLPQLTEGQYNFLMDRVFSNSRSALAYMSDYTNEDMVNALYNEDSFNAWIISPPMRDQLARDLENSTKILNLRFGWEFVRPSKKKQGAARTAGERVIPLNPGDKLRRGLAEVLNGRKKKVKIPRLYFPFVDVPPTGAAAANEVLEQAACSDALGSRKNASASYISSECRKETSDVAYVDVEMTLKQDTANVWWNVQMLKPGWLRGDPTAKANTSTLTITAFVSKVFPSALDSVMSGGIIGVYVVVVLAIGRVIRGVIAGSLPDIQYDEVPNIDYVLGLCLDIFLVREAAEFLLEIELFAKLLFLFRSPATLIEMTRPKQD